MPGQVKDKVLIAQGGGPTAVINCSLYGVVREASADGRVGGILGARHGITGVLEERFVDLRKQSAATIEGLRRTPAAALGSCRYKVKQADYGRLLEVFERWGIRYFFYNGGNDSMDTAMQVHRLAQAQGYDLTVVGIPKTIDNDLPMTDRCPGFGSAARYVGQSVRDLGMDIRALPTPVSIFETMGRNAGWLAGASVLAKTDADSAPHLIYLPERPVAVADFLGDVDRVVKRLGRVVVVVSEGLRGEDGQAIFSHGGAQQTDAFGHALPGDVGSFLAGRVSAELGLRCRSEKPGLCGRSSMLHVSPVDQADAEAVGRAAVRAALTGQGGRMVTLEAGGEPGQPRTGLVDLAAVASVEKLVPNEWIDEKRRMVTRAFYDYVRRQIGPKLLEYARLEM